ncbi:MAG: hypothetical protein HGB04_02215 [Chlorobiaceae bacterium]|nr:hypothetical protein [Chlorobiaceae bacterium]
MKQLCHAGAGIAVSLLLTIGSTAIAETTTTFGENNSGTTGSSASPASIAMDNGQSYLIYGNMVQSTCTATQNVSNLNVTVTNNPSTNPTSSVNLSNSTVSNGTGVSVGSGILQINNSATAIVVGGNYSNSSTTNK